MKQYKAPELVEPHKGKPLVFLAGSIEQGKAVLWQDKIAALLADLDIVVANPRRDVWNPDLPQDPTPGTDFYEQVVWEQTNIIDSDLVVFYFDPATISPVTLLELGQCIGDNKDILVYCPKDYFRYGNVRITMHMNFYEDALYTDEDRFMKAVLAAAKRLEREVFR